MVEITILRSDRDLAKTHIATADGWITNAFSDPYEFDTETMAVTDIHEFHALLTALEADPRRCLIHGSLKAGMPSRGRRILHEQRNGDVGRFEGRETVSWLCIDIDKMPCPADLQGGNSREMLAARLAHICRELPRDFQNVTFSYAWSASAGVRSWETLSVHLWFWIANPTSLDAIKARAEAEAWIADRSLMSAVQIHYTAAPVFRGAEDPLKNHRSGFIELDHDGVTLSPWSAPVREPRTAAQKLAAITPTSRPSRSGDGTDFKSTPELDAILNRIGQHLHDPIRTAIGHYTAMTAPGDRDYDGLKKEIVARINDAEKRSGSDPNITRSVDDFASHRDDAYLERLTDGADFKYQATPDVMKKALATKVLKQWNKQKAAKNRRLR